MPDPTKPDTRILTPDEVDRIEADYQRGYVSNRGDTGDLCQTVRAAWQQYEGAVSDFAAEINSLRAQLAQVEQERDLAYADGYNNGIRHGKQSRAPVAVTSIVIDREEAAKMAFEAVRSVLQSDWAERYSVLQIAGMVAANVRRLSPAVAATVNDEAHDGFRDLLPLTPVRVAPGEYDVKSRDGRTLWRMEGAALADWVCASVNGYDGAINSLTAAAAPASPAQPARDAAREIIDHLLMVEREELPRTADIAAIISRHSHAARPLDEAAMNWALRELADGWIDNNEREGPYGFYRNARRVLNIIAATDNEEAK